MIRVGWSRWMSVRPASAFFSLGGLGEGGGREKEETKDDYGVKQVDFR